MTRRCINCETLVSTQAFHRKDALTTFLVGESVLGWPKAHAALKKVLPCMMQCSTQGGRGSYSSNLSPA